MFSAILNSLVAFNFFSFSSFQVVLPINHLPWVFLSSNTLYYHSCCSGRSGHLAQQIMALTNLLFTPTKNNANWQRKPLAECCLCFAACSHFLKKWCLMFDVRRKNNAKSLQHFTRRVRSGKKCIHFSLHY